MGSPTTAVVAAICDRVAVASPRCGRVRVIAVDGGAAAGKTSLATALQAALRADGRTVQTLHTDLLLDGWRGQFTFWDRLRASVLLPLAAGRTGRYHRYDWRRGQFDGAATVPPTEVLIVEGVSAIAACGDLAAVTVFLELERDERERRWTARDGLVLQPEWRAWLDAEDRFFAERPVADVVVRDDELADPPAVRRLGGREVYANPWMRVLEDDIELADGSRSRYGTVVKDDFVLVVPWTGRGFWLVEQYRYPVRSRQWEFCQGGWAHGAGGTPEQLAIVELAEEVGLAAATLTRLGRLFAAYGYSGQAFDVFLATGLSEGAPDREPSEQDMQHRWFTESQVRAMVADGQLRDAHSLAALTLFDSYRGREEA